MAVVRDFQPNDNFGLNYSSIWFLLARSRLEKSGEITSAKIKKQLLNLPRKNPRQKEVGKTDKITGLKTMLFFRQE